MPDSHLERQLAESQALAHIGSWRWDIVSNQVTWSDEHYRIWGIPLGTPVTMSTVANSIHPADRDRVQRIIAQSLVDGRPYRIEFRVCRPDGTERVVEARAHLELETGRCIRHYGTAQDITDRMRTQELRDHLLARAISAQEDERTRIARELHDETGQALTAILLGLRGIQEATDPEQIRALCERLRDLTAHTIRDVGRISRGLRPSTLDDLGLVPALRRYAEDLESASSLEITISDGALPRLRPELETAVYRIIQEALTNVARHAAAHHASVTLAARDAMIHVTIEDDGQGFDVEHAFRGDGHGLGLVGMRERANLVGGRLEVRSQQQTGGSRIIMEAPLERAG